jgi:hypothetical protein
MGADAVTAVRAVPEKRSARMTFAMAIVGGRNRIIERFHVDGNLWIYPTGTVILDTFAHRTVRPTINFLERPRPSLVRAGDRRWLRQSSEGSCQARRKDG